MNTIQTQKRFALVVSIIAVSLLLTPAYAKVARTGTITHPTTLQVGDTVKDFHVVTVDGRNTSFKKLRDSVSLVAFVDQNSQAHAKLKQLADRYDKRYASVIEITTDADHVHDKSHVGHPLVSLHDSDGIAARAYGQPELGTVFLVDATHHIVRVGSLNKLKAIERHLDRLVREVEAFKAQALQGG